MRKFVADASPQTSLGLQLALSAGLRASWPDLRKHKRNKREGQSKRQEGKEWDGWETTPKIGFWLWPCEAGIVFIGVCLSVLDVCVCVSLYATITKTENYYIRN